VFFSRLYLTDNIQDDSGYLPSSYPDQGLVISVYPPMREYDKLILMRRSRDFFRQRYAYYNTKILWPQLDIFGLKCGYYDKFVIPRRSKTLGEFYKQYWGLKDFTLVRRSNPVDEQLLTFNLIKRLLFTKSKESFILYMIDNWGNALSGPWLRLWFDNGYQLNYVLGILKSSGKSFRSVVELCEKEIYDRRCRQQEREEQFDLLRKKNIIMRERNIREDNIVDKKLNGED